jgi:hypothetical protein
MLSRKEFDQTFAGPDLTIQVRAAIDFAQQHDLALARSTGDQQFLFSRLPNASKGGRNQPVNERRQAKANHKTGFARRRKGSSQRPIGRSF